MAASAEIPGTIVKRLLSARKYGKERVKQFIKKEIAIPGSKFLGSTIATSLKKKKKRKLISVLKEDHQALCLFVEKYPVKQEVFKYLLKNFPLAISIPEGKLYQPENKYLFRSYLTELSNAEVSEIIVTSNPIVIYDTMAIVRLVTSEKTWDSLLQTFVKPFRLQEAEETLLVFDNYSDNQEFSLKVQERINRVIDGTVINHYLSLRIR